LSRPTPAASRSTRSTCKDPGSEATYLALFSNFVAHPEELAKAYKDKYGKDVEYTYDASALGFEADNAGYEYPLSSLPAQDAPSSATATRSPRPSPTPPRTPPPWAWPPAGKLGGPGRQRLAHRLGHRPGSYTVSTQNTSYVYTLTWLRSAPPAPASSSASCSAATTAPATATRPLLKAGSWSIRDDYTNDKNPFALSDSHTISSDLSAVYNHYLDVSDFWTYWHDKSPNK
jgi:hypothetical protein